MKRFPIRISDHAVLRYLERVKGVDMQALRHEIAAKVCVATEYADMGVSGVVVDGYSYKIQKGTVTTVIDANQPPKGAVTACRDTRGVGDLEHQSKGVKR